MCNAAFDEAVDLRLRFFSELPFTGLEYLGPFLTLSLFDFRGAFSVCAICGGIPNKSEVLANVRGALS